MRLAELATLQRAIWNNPDIAEPTEVNGQPARAIWNPEDADVPGAELARRSARVTTLAFRESDGLDLRRGAKILFRGAAYVVDGSPTVRDAMVVVALLPDAMPVTGRSYSSAYGPSYS